MSRLTRDGTAEPVSRDQILRHARGQGNVHFPSSADHEQDWQPYPVDPFSAICDDHTYIHTYIHTCMAINVVSAQIKFVGHTSLMYLYSPLSDPISIFFCLSRRCPLLATFLSVLFSLLSLLISERFSGSISFGSVYLVTTAGFVADQLRDMIYRHSSVK